MTDIIRYLLEWDIWGKHGLQNLVDYFVVIVLSYETDHKPKLSVGDDDEND